MWHQRLLPYPLLSRSTDDYPLSGFNCQVNKSVLSNGETINLTLDYQLNCQSIQTLIDQQQADYAVQTTCSRTYKREMYPAQQKRVQYLALPAKDYAHEIITTPYIVATKEIHGFTSRDHATEIRELKPEGFHLQGGSILAVADSIRITIKETSPQSVIDLVTSSITPQGQYEIDLASDRIKIYLSPEDKLVLERIRSQKHDHPGKTALTTTFYLNAVTEALHCIEEYPETTWAEAIRTALERHHLNTSTKALQNNAARYAQIILEAPLGKLLNVLSTQAEGE